MTRISTRRAPVLGGALTALAVAATLAALPAAAGAQDPGPPAGYFSTVYRQWWFGGCAQGTLIARPEQVIGDVVCTTGVASWGQVASTGDWQLLVNMQQTGGPGLLFGPRLEPMNSFVRFLYSGPGCAAQPCSDSDLAMMLPPTPGSPVNFTVISPSALTSLGQMDPRSFDLTGIFLGYSYVPWGGLQVGGWGVAMAPTLSTVPEPGTLSLTASALGGLAAGALARRRRQGGSGRAA